MKSGNGRELIITLLLITGMIALIGGCSGKALPMSPTTEAQPTTQVQAQPPVKEFNITAKNWQFTPAEITVNKGDTVRILATTPKGQEIHKHGFTIDEYGINAAVQSSDEANPVKIEFVADKAGTFKIYCKTCNDDDGFKGKFGSTHPVIQGTLEVK